MKYLKRNATVDAIQWNKDGDHPNVKAAGPKIYTKGAAYYITGLSAHDGEGKLIHLPGDFWLDLERKAENGYKEDSKALWEPTWMQIGSDVEGEPNYFRRLWHFSMFKMHGEKVERDIDMNDREDVLRYADWQIAVRGVQRRMGRGELTFTPYGWMTPGDKTGRIVVYPGDWIVTNPDGSVEIISGDKFDDLYEAV